jgi:hypothetical protein
MGFLRPQIDSDFRARLSAPGFLDCTDWEECNSLESAIRYLADTFGDSFDSEDWLELAEYDQRLADFFEGYFLALGFTATDYDGNQLFPCSGEFTDYYDSEDIRKKIDDSDLPNYFSEAFDFFCRATDSDSCDDCLDWAAFGANFHYSRNGHGTGFFDSDLKNRDYLQNLAKNFGELELN